MRTGSSKWKLHRRDIIDHLAPMQYLPNYENTITVYRVEKEQSRSIEKISKFEKEMGCILEANRNLQEDCHRERLLRKKYYNMVEELKGKIRVFCRIRPPSKSEKINNEIIAKCSDPYTISLETLKGHKEFQFDRVFTQEDTQEEIFADTQVFTCFWVSCQTNVLLLTVPRRVLSSNHEKYLLRYEL
ncbi:Kinesin-like calmodulin-binding protein [Orchesella cincta]|uniref:Kinesin-like calmodulin-binding protein n=1 Tax=Orchesella cincta TaxID=48709 RepID=A0A1D2NAF2_ORCCI|nr:Kinesin-like calmodulin-binding protein [Orchesella cincta]